MIPEVMEEVTKRIGRVKGSVMVLVGGWVVVSVVLGEGLVMVEGMLGTEVLEGVRMQANEKVYQPRDECRGADTDGRQLREMSSGSRLRR